MELEAEDDAVGIPIGAGSKTEIGRGLGFSSSDRTVSRRHISFQLLAPAGGDQEVKTGPDAEIRVSFEVVGKNPILVVSGSGGGKRMFRKSEVGELGEGDRVSLSLKNPFFFSLKKRGGDEVEKSVLDAVRRREKRTLQRKKDKEEEDRKESERVKLPSDRNEEEGVDAGLGLGFQMPDFLQIDPIKEFGFLVRGHEFDKYPRQKVRSIKDWNWFLDEPRENSDDGEDPNEVTPKRKKGEERQKRRKGEDNDDEEWTGESEDEKIVVAKDGSAKRPKYSTRSKDRKKQCQSASAGEKPLQVKAGTVRVHKKEIEEEDGEDETLGGFIVNDNNEEEEEEEEEEKEEEEEEEEFDDDDEDD